MENALTFLQRLTESTAVDLNFSHTTLFTISCSSYTEICFKAYTCTIRVYPSCGKLFWHVPPLDYGVEPMSNAFPLGNSPA